MTDGWTYGAEFELADWDQRAPLPEFVWGLDQDWTMVNSCGVAVDPSGKLFHLGGEVQSSPAEAPSGVAEQLAEFCRLHPAATVNYRSNLHVHVRVPGLREDLGRLKRLQAYCARWLPSLLPLIEPIPEPTRADYPGEAEWRGARRRYARRKVSHQKIMPAETVARQMKARTLREFFDAEALHVPSGKLYWATKPRCAVNLRQLLQTDTIEFRHFPGTTDYQECLWAVRWCVDFLTLAFVGDEHDPSELYKLGYAGSPWPSFRPYSHWHEVRYRATRAHLVGPEAARSAIRRVLDGTFDEGSN